MFRKSGFLVGWMLVLALAGCMTFNVRTDWDATFSFDGMQRYFWVEPPEREGSDPFVDNSLLRKRVRLAVEEVFAERGFRLVSSREEADLVVTYSVILEERLRVDGVTTGVGYGTIYPRGSFGYVGANTTVRNYQESTLILDLLDPKTDELRWRGWGTGIVGTRDRERYRRQERMTKGVRAILDRFPPREQES